MFFRNLIESKKFLSISERIIPFFQEEEEKDHQSQFFMKLAEYKPSDVYETISLIKWFLLRSRRHIIRCLGCSEYYYSSETNMEMTEQQGEILSFQKFARKLYTTEMTFSQWNCLKLELAEERRSYQTEDLFLSDKNMNFDFKIFGFNDFDYKIFSSVQRFCFLITSLILYKFYVFLSFPFPIP